MAATHADYTPIGSSSLYPGLSTPARKGETVILWATGFGLPNEPLTPGSSTQIGSLPETPVCTIGAYPASLLISLVSPGLYQLNMKVPPEAGSGDDPVTCTYRRTATQDGAAITVQ